MPVRYYAVLGAHPVGPEGTEVAVEPFPESVLAIGRKDAENDIDHITVVGKAIVRSGANLVL